MKEWYIRIGGHQYGPVEATEVETLVRTTQAGITIEVWRTGMGSWMDVRMVPEFGGISLDAPSLQGQGDATIPAARPVEARTPPPLPYRTSKHQRAMGKNPWIALVLSLLIVGLGQFYNGDCKKGLTMLVAAIVSGAFSFGLLWFGIAIWSAIDAYRVASGKGGFWR